MLCYGHVIMLHSSDVDMLLYCNSVLLLLRSGVAELIAIMQMPMCLSVKLN